MLSSVQQSKIKNAFRAGKLKVRSASPEGEMEWKRVLDVHRADVGPESIWEAQTEAGPMVLTGGHRVFVSPTEKVEMEKLEVGQTTLGIDHEQVGAPTILGLKKIEDRQYMYDLTAEDWHNFVLHRSKVVISNSPDRNYKFRPPEQAGVVRQFNQVFGFIWEDYELIEYIIRAIAWFNMFPPSTGIRTIDQLVQQAPEWCTAVFMQAIVHAAMALSFNWSADEFDYSIGGISMSIEKSSKYESLKSNAESQFQMAVEAKKNTTLFIRGLCQPRYGMGVRSAFGPAVGRGVLSPRSFI